MFLSLQCLFRCAWSPVDCTRRTTGTGRQSAIQLRASCSDKVLTMELVAELRAASTTSVTNCPPLMAHPLVAMASTPSIVRKRTCLSDCFKIDSFMLLAFI